MTENNIFGNDVVIPHPELVNIYDSIIGDGTKIAAFVEIGRSRIGRNCRIQAFAYIPPNTLIEDDVFIGPHVCFTNVKRPQAKLDQRKFLNGVNVDRCAVIGANATILPGVRIGEFAVVGAGAVVTKDVAPHTTVVGNPAKVMGK